MKPRAPKPGPTGPTGPTSPSGGTALNALRRIVRAIRASSHATERAHGITGAQLFVLQQLAEGPVASLRELAARTLTDESSVSVVVSRLVRKKLIVRRRSGADARRIELSLSAAGGALLRKAPEPAQARLVKALARVDARELSVMARVLDVIADDMGAAAEPRMFFERESSGKPGSTAEPASTRKKKRHA
jgi:DNA-binding MarR family transcriptional regulator